MTDESPVIPRENVTHVRTQYRQGVAAIFLGLIAFSVAGGLYYWKASEVMASANWPQAPGVVEACNVLKTLGTRSGLQFQVQIKYSYNVAGKTFHGDRYNTHNNYTNGEGEASNVGLRYRAGSKCTVAYNPTDPARSYLDTTISWHTWATVVISAIMGIAGTGFIVLGLAKMIFPHKFARPKAEPEQAPGMDDRIVIGPLFTRGGFQAWYFVCFADTIVAVPQGLWFAVTSSASGAGFHFGLVGGAIEGALGGSRQAHESKAIVKLKADPKSALLAKGSNVVYSTSDIVSIEVKRRLMTHPEVIVICRDQKRRVYGVTAPDACEKIKQTLAALYPNLCPSAEPASK